MNTRRLPGEAQWKGDIRDHTTAAVAFLDSYSTPKLSKEDQEYVVEATAAIRARGKP